MPIAALVALGLLGCGSSAPHPLERIRSGDLTALPLLATDPDAPLGPIAARLLAMQAEGQAVRAAEGAMLRDAAAAALATGDLGRGAAVLASARRALPDDPALAELEAQLRAELLDADAASRAAVLEAQAEAEPDPVKARVLAREAAVERAAARVAADAFPGVLPLLGGAGVAPASALLAQIDAEYHEPVSWSDAATLAHRALERVRSSEDAQTRWPALSDVRPPRSPVVDLRTALEDLSRTVAVYGAAGVPESVVVDTWVRTALAALDPWSRPVWAAEIATWERGHAGSHVGVGLELAASEAGVTVRRPLPDAPAWASGIHQGDRLLLVADDRGSVRLELQSPDKALALAETALRGPEGSEARITVDREGAQHTFSVTRGSVVLPTVRGWSRAPDNTWEPWLDRERGIAYVRVERFKPPTLDDFDALLEPHLDDVRAVVLDLRGNPGGDVNAAVQIADRFVASGRLAELSGRVLPETGPDVDPVTGEALAAWNDAIPGHALEGLPVAVLVDADTASAAEVLAGALDEQAGAFIIGEATWGKGEAQALRTSPQHRYAVQFTNVVWTLPSGRRLARGLAGGGGVQPTVPVALSPGERFQVDRAARERSALRVHHDGTPMTWTDPGRRDDLPPLSGDPVATAAELLLRVSLPPAPEE